MIGIDLFSAAVWFIMHLFGGHFLTSDTDDERKRQAQWEMAAQNSLNDATGLKRHNGQKQSKLIQYIFD